jgi:hypothetical protein
VIELGGPFFFYRNFWRTHGIEHIAGVVGAEVDVTYGSYLHVPLILNSSWADTVSVTIRGKYPPGWKSAGGECICRLAPGESHPVELFVRCPAESGGNRVKLVWEVQRGGSVVGFTELAVGLVEWALPQ